MLKSAARKINHWVFWPPFVLLSGALILSLVDKEGFLALATPANDWILRNFDIAFSHTSFLMVVFCFILLISPLGKIRIGGDQAVPILNRWRWFAIVLCTTVAVGILFWGVAEPLYHLSSPPQSHSASPGSEEARKFAMSTMFMHWTFTPYAIYSIPALLFAIGYYNYKGPYSLTSMLFAFPSVQRQKWLIKLVDAICLFALVAGMAAALGAGILSLTGGVSRLTGQPVNALTTGLITLLIVVTFSISAATGLLKGIRILSSFNLTILIILCLFLLFLGPTASILHGLVDGLSSYVGNFVSHSLAIGEFSDASWTRSWTTFYWAIWMAWAPITCLFLGRIGYGYTLREFLLFNWILPSVFSIVWMSVFSGTSLFMEMNNQAPLVEVLSDSGPEAVIYSIFDQLPFTGVMILFFLVTMFISYVTAADSTTEAMSGISAEGVSPEYPNPPLLIKFLWGIIVGVVAWVMISYSGIDGVKMLSNLGGLPALFLIILLNLALVKWFWDKWLKPKK